MTQIDIVAATSDDTVVAEYKPSSVRATSYQLESELEDEFLHLLRMQGYEQPTIRNEAQLVENLRRQLERLNDYQFSDDEWKRFFHGCLANNAEPVEEKTRRLQEDDTVQALRRDDGSTKNITLIDKKHIHHNHLQVIHQYSTGKGAGTARYDVTVLVNGLPLVHIELKKRGVAIREAFDQIARYQEDYFSEGYGLFQYVQIFVISNGTDTKYYSNTTRRDAAKAARRGKEKKTSDDFKFTSFWADAKNKPIPDLMDFATTFFAKHTLLKILTKFCVFTSERMLMVMRPYQIAAAERILNTIEIANNNKLYGSIKAGGYIWHTTGSGKTLTSFKTAQLATKLEFIDKVLFVVDRKDLDYQTMKEYDRFEKGAANSNTSTEVLKRQLEDDNAKIIITTIQKLSFFVKQNKKHPVYQQHVVIIFDECHRSQFGDMHAAIVKNFKNYYIFGFTGTPIFAPKDPSPLATTLTTEQIFGEKIHTYTIVNAIKDENVLPFHVDYLKTMSAAEDTEDEMVPDIDREAAYNAPERIQRITAYVLDHFDQKTHREGRSYDYRTITNIAEVASAARGKVEERKRAQQLKGFNSIFAVASIKRAKLYYEEFQRQMKEKPEKALKIALIYSYGANTEAGGLLDEENSEDASALDKSSREFLDSAIRDYNEMFHTFYSTEGDRFQNYYKDVSLRMKNKELDMLIVVNMFLTGFDATTLNTLWVDKKLKQHGLIQAFSRTNRILNSVKSCGNIVCFGDMREQVDEAIAMFGADDAGRIVFIRRFEDLLNGCEENGVHFPGYADMVMELRENYPLDERDTWGEKKEKAYAKLIGAVLRRRNVLKNFDEFESQDPLTKRELQDHLSYYQDLHDKRRRPQGEKIDITDDVVFEIELIKQVDIDIDYILALIEKRRRAALKDKEVKEQVIKEMHEDIIKAVSASPKLRSKRALIEAFIGMLDEVTDVFAEWQAFANEQREKELGQLIQSERLNERETRRFLENAFRDGAIKTTGTELSKIMPPMSRFDGSGREKKKQAIIEKLGQFLEKYSGIGGEFKA